MPNLLQSFQGRDFGFLRIVSRLWGIELRASEIEKGKKELSKALLDPILFKDMMDSLPDDARLALNALANAEGKLPWAIFTRRFGEIRETGPGRRDRDQIFLNPVSPTEALFYRALIAKAFFELPAGAQEFAYIPSDFLELSNFEKPFDDSVVDVVSEPGDKNTNHITSKIIVRSLESLGRPAIPNERAQPLASSDRLLDDATTLLAALRTGLPLPQTRIPVEVVLDFLSAANIIHSFSLDKIAGGETPLIDAVRRFLEASRKYAMEILITAWMESDLFNELRQVPGFICEGEWVNQPLVTRKYLLSLFKAIPKNKWWSLPAFVHSLKEKNPDFQRPAGDYDSWFIKRASDNEYLRGFVNWDEVDGALISYMITGPLYWLGFVDLATPVGSNVVSAFRINNNKSRIQVAETARLIVSSQGKIVIPRLFPRLARYQIARFCDWDPEKDREYHYLITTTSLKRAVEKGLKVRQLLTLLARNSVAEIPPTIVKALKRWEVKGTEARLETRTLLKVSDPDILQELRKSKAERFLGETLGPVTVTIKKGAQHKVLAALAEMGLLGEEVHEE
jgi:hypothetical protein